MGVGGWGLGVEAGAGPALTEEEEDEEKLLRHCEQQVALLAVRPEGEQEEAREHRGDEADHQPHEGAPRVDEQHPPREHAAAREVEYLPREQRRPVAAVEEGGGAHERAAVRLPAR